jgi:hypothetical protein
MTAPRERPAFAKSLLGAIGRRLQSLALALGDAHDDIAVGFASREQTLLPARYREPPTEPSR